MTLQERRGLEMMFDASPYKGPVPVTLSYPAMRAFRAAQAWIERQLKLDDRRRKPRGNYRRSR